jgi:Mg-chelatase subunit ChlD
MVIRKYTLEDAKTRPGEVSQAVADHIAGEYLYSVGPRPETDPIDALKAGAFRCDIAAFSMVGLIRDHYHLPARVVGGYRAKSFQNGSDKKSYLVVPNEPHAFVEVFYDGKWNLYDPTPVKKDSKDPKKGDSEYSDNKLENTLSPSIEDEAATAKPWEKKDEKDTVSKKDDHKKRLDADTKSRTDKVKDTELSKKEKEKKTTENEMSRDDLADQLELGSLRLEPKLDRNALLERAMRVVLQTSLDPTKEGAVTLNRLSQIASLLRRHNSPTLKALYQKALSAHQKDHPDIKNWVDGLTRRLPNQDPMLTYQELYRMRLALETYTKVLDHGGKIRPPAELTEILQKAQEKFEQLAHPDSKDIGLVEDLVKNLPSIPRLLLKSDYDLSQVGANAGTKKVAAELKAGNLNDLRLLSILSPLSDFILNSTPRPEYIDVKTWQRDYSRPRGRDLLPLQRFSDLTRAIFTQPGKSIEENIKEGTAFVPTRRRRVQIAAGYGKEEAERITIVLYDTSGSMSGDPGRFQAGLIAAFTSKALSDLSPGGKHRHRVVIVPFDDTPKTPVVVANTAECLDVIRNYQQKLANTNGSTDVQKALLQAMSLIADAEKQAGEPLAAANIVLMTDGQATISADELLKARKAIDRETPLQTMFIGINNTNEELMRFAMDSQSMGSDSGFYREFTAEHIKDILAESDTLNLENRNDFYTDKKASELPGEVYTLMEQALRLAAQYSDHVYYGSQHISAREHLELLEKVKWLDIKEIDRPLEKWLIRVRQLVLHPIFKDQRLLERVVDDLVSNVERLTGIKPSDMSDHEQEQLRHLVRFAAGLEDRP